MWSFIRKLLDTKYSQFSVTQGGQNQFNYCQAMMISRYNIMPFSCSLHGPTNHVPCPLHKLTSKYFMY